MTQQLYRDYTVEQDKKYFLALLEKFNWKMAESAKAAGIARKTLWQKIKKYQLKKPEKNQLPTVLAS